MTDQNFASGTPIPVTTQQAENNYRLTITGTDSGTIIVDEPMVFGNNGHVEISCRGTGKSSFTTSHLAGLTVLHETGVVETAGRGCQQMAGKVLSSNPQGSHHIVQLSGDTMVWINGVSDADRPTKAFDTLIQTYKRVSR